MRALVVDEGLCIGCRACASVCPVAYISLTDDGSHRVIRFPASCEEDCTLCLEACPKGAIALQEVSQVEEAVEFSFVLRCCARCGRPFAPEKALADIAPRIAEAIAAEPGDWLDLCWSCRREETARGLLEASRA